MPETSPDPDPGPREPSGPQEPTGRDRLVRALRTPSRTQLVVAVLLALLGFGVVTQVRATEVDDTYAGYRQQDLIDVLNGLAGARQRAQAEITNLEEIRDELLSDTTAHRAALAQAESEAENLAILAGTVPVTGPGIRVTITENDAPIDLMNVLEMVQQLRSAGAEAIQFNGEVRVVAQTAFEDGPGGVYVDEHLVTPPYVVDVIGDPQSLQSYIDFAREGAVQQFEADGATVEVQQLESLDIESTVQAPVPEHAEPTGTP